MFINTLYKGHPNNVLQMNYTAFIYHLESILNISCNFTTNNCVMFVKHFILC